MTFNANTFNITTKEQHNFTLIMLTTFLIIRQVQLYWLDSGSLNSNLADCAPTLAQSKAAALYVIVDL